jgi:hypothetical protein
MKGEALRGMALRKGVPQMKPRGLVSWMTGMALLAGSALAGAQNLSQGTVVVTVLPKHEGEVPLSVAQQDLSAKVDGKNAEVTLWRPYAASDHVELVLLLDDGSRSSLGRQISDIEQFVKTLPPNVRVAIAYMQNGSAIFETPLSTDPAVVLKGLHLPSGGPGSSASPYFCLSELARHWPSNDTTARREVVMVTDGVDLYQMGFDPDNPHMQAAIEDAARAHLIVDSIYWQMEGRPGPRYGESFVGQGMLQIVAEATGGKSFYMGSGNPVSFAPYLNEMQRRFRNQYVLGFTAPAGRKPSVEELRIKLRVSGADVDVPHKVWMTPVAK